MRSGFRHLDVAKAGVGQEDQGPTRAGNDRLS